FEPSALAQWLQHDAGELDHVPDGRLQINNGEALRSAALHGLGIVLQSTLLLAADVEAGRLVQLFPEYGQAGRPMHVVYAHDRYHSTRLR
ncbi:LysR substrate-binding domain-containing protein, partial [Stenotrophomonas maltophilia]|uniref:LysR substrate-binding domain-containing protein n=2 Tax=Lysobacteraceae TaxID=32033 RepID=UPI001EF77608